MKRVISLLLAALLAAAFSACMQGGGSRAADAEGSSGLRQPSGEAGGAPGASSRTASREDAAPAEENPSPWLEDYETFWTLVEENYPF